jgi:4-diphosphocytidyl-2-C-methyl-D-erythritol kinase
LGRRPDGYHRLQTLFQFLDLNDTLLLKRRADGGILRTQNLPDIPESVDLTLRAARLLQSVSGTSQGVEITLVKRLPIGAGLGGGSSDAASVLVGLNRLWCLGLSRATLMNLGVQLGADVPVFVGGESAWAEGIGENLRPFFLESALFLVIFPPVFVSTKAVFQDPELTRTGLAITIEDFFAGHHRNDCESLVCRRYPLVGEVMAWLSSRANPRLTGTGACVFARFPTQEAAEQVARDCPWPARVSRGLTRSPLCEF